MKIILSRKGFDSANGGIVSPILKDGTMVSLPIPDNGDQTNFSDLVVNRKTYKKLLDDLGYKGDCDTCHLDPDLDNRRQKNKIENWKPAFGQSGASAGYLRDSVQVEEGDIFLFFGNLHFVEEKNGKYQYCTNTGNFYKDEDLQVIWGYLQVGKILTEKEEIEKYSWHPHGQGERLYKTNNTLYCPADRLSLNPKLPGCGLLEFSHKRVLTQKNMRKATWKYQKEYAPENLIGERKNCADNPQKGIYYKGIWQELGLKDSSITVQWAKKILLNEDSGIQMKYIDPVKTFEERLVKNLGFDKYEEIMNVYNVTDVSSSEQFQKQFNAFYRVRRNKTWRDAYYSLFENLKNSNPSFEIILKEMYKITGQVEASFSSKMLATINPDMPIWDSLVLNSLGLKAPNMYSDTRIEECVELYDRICKWYDTYLDTENARECIKEFDRIIPSYKWLSDVKKIDFFLWSIR